MTTDAAAATPDAAPLLSVVVPTRGRPLLVRALEALDRQTLRDRLEVIVVGRVEDEAVARALASFVERFPRALHLPLSFATGDSSRKKNAGWQASLAPVVAFLDDDAIAPPGWAERILAPFADPAVRLSSGPGRVPDDAPPLARLAGLALASRAAGYVAGRYHGSASPPHPAAWSRLIGCNMAWRRSALEEIGGFDPAFWPGEEMIASWRAVGRRAERLRVHPGAGVDHYPRVALGAFWRQVAGYGATRIRLLRAGTDIEWPSLAPAAALAGGVLLAAAALFSRAAGWTLAATAALYALFTAWAAVETARDTRRARDAAVALLIPLMHLAYGWGSWREIVRPDRDLGGAPD